MMRHFGIAIIALAVTALPARADGPYGFSFDARLSGSFQWNCWNGCGPSCGPCFGGCGPVCAPLAPWYLYWPMDAHFQAPAPISYPYWPAPQTPPGVAPPVRPVSYHPSVPSYWYGR
jgi:hypothetical protein